MFSGQNKGHIPLKHMKTTGKPLFQQENRGDPIVQIDQFCLKTGAVFSLANHWKSVFQKEKKSNTEN